MNKTEVVLIKVVKPHCDAAKVLQPREQPLNLPPAPVAPEGPAILRRRFHSVRFMRRNHLDALLAKLLIQRIRVICPVAYKSLWLFIGKNFSESFSDKPDFMRRS